MAWFGPLASGFLSRGAMNRVARMIPNPALRYAAVLAASTVVPYLAAKAASRLQNDPKREQQKTHLFPKSKGYGRNRG